MTNPITGTCSKQNPIEQQTYSQGTHSLGSQLRRVPARRTIARQTEDRGGENTDEINRMNEIRRPINRITNERRFIRQIYSFTSCERLFADKLERRVSARDFRLDELFDGLVHFCNDCFAAYEDVSS